MQYSCTNKETNRPVKELFYPVAEFLPGATDNARRSTKAFFKCSRKVSKAGVADGRGHLFHTEIALRQQRPRLLHAVLMEIGKHAGAKNLAESTFKLEIIYADLPGQCQQRGRLAQVPEQDVAGTINTIDILRAK